MAEGIFKMKERSESSQTSRIKKILAFIDQLTAGNLDIPDIPSGKGDDLDQIAEGLNKLAKRLSADYLSYA